MTAAFEGLPETHDGSSAFTFRLVFSAAVTTDAATMRDEVRDVTGGAGDGRAPRPPRAQGPIPEPQMERSPARRWLRNPRLRPTWRPLLTGLVAQLGDRAAGGELVPRVAGRHLRRLPIAGLLQLDQTGAGGRERLR